MTNTSGAHVVMLHSGGMSGRQWRRLGERLAADHDVIAPDFIGSGDEPAFADDPAFDFAADVDRVIARVEALGVPVHLVGHSYGGLVAVTVARRVPQLVRSIAVYDPVAFGVLHGDNDVAGLADLARAADDPVFLDDERGGSDDWFTAFVDYWNGVGAWRAMQPAARDAFLRVGRKVFREVSSLMTDRTPADAYDVVKAPALVLAGERSPLAAQRVGALLALGFANGRLEVVAGAGHMGPPTPTWSTPRSQRTSRPPRSQNSGRRRSTLVKRGLRASSGSKPTKASAIMRWPIPKT